MAVFAVLFGELLVVLFGALLVASFVTTTAYSNEDKKLVDLQSSFIALN